mmetsp:Transcript_29529/g.44935  ORF Transcript_29529/g.44935 Transcript_29529/m.44935 type:complete len:83 (+) Transcript_29529:3384-3632(+)
MNHGNSSSSERINFPKARATAEFFLSSNFDTFSAKKDKNEIEEIKSDSDEHNSSSSNGGASQFAKIQEQPLIDEVSDASGAS